MNSKRWQFLLIGLGLICLFSESGYGQQTNEKKGKKPDAKLIEETYKKTQDLIRRNQWEQASKLMTQQAGDDLCIRQIEPAFCLLVMESMSDRVPGLKPMIPKLKNVVKKYRLEEVDTSVMEKFTKNRSRKLDANDIKEFQEATKKNNELILKTLKKNKTQWKATSEFGGILDNQFKVPVFQENFVSVKVDGEKATITAQTMQSFTLQKGPLVFLQYRKEKSKGWIYDGLDKKKTDQSVREFLKKNRR